MFLRVPLLAALPTALFCLLPRIAAAEVLERDRYHNIAQMDSQIKELVKSHRNIARLHIYGKSYQKRELLVIEVTDFSSGKSDEKPGVLLTAGLQGDEPGAAEIAVQMLAVLLDRHGTDKAVTDLLNLD